MNFPTVTIPDPAAVGKWLDEQVPTYDNSPHYPQWWNGAWAVLHWMPEAKSVTAKGDSPELVLADLREKLAEHDPLAKLRKEWESLGCPELKKQD